jgi:SOS response regulatory protein OraA/RecX
VTEDRDALSLALRALGQKERSVAELGSWLRQRGVADDDAE